ncbi:MAG: Tad domain-containing protein [Paracoccaceae bacterium]
MWNINKFKREEDGALLVFFAICSAAIFLIAALSFDVGRRASTQTDLQSFADNVALAAAGELNGLPGAISRARRAADELIDDSTRFSDDNDLGGLGDFALTFYQTLPDDEDTWATPVSYNVASDLNPGDAQARFVRIEVNPRDVEWQFANILSIFTDNALPDEAVAAEATAGYTSLACDIAPIFFCMPPRTQADIDANSPIWDPSNHLGESVLLRTGGGPNSWGPGNYGYLNVVNMTPEEAKADPAGPCFGESGANLYSCLIGAESALTLCFENGSLRYLTGNGDGYRSATLNTKFDMYNAALSGEQDDDRFRPGPVVTKRYAEGDTCAPDGGGGGGQGQGQGQGQGGGGTAPLINESTTDFPLDDCFTDGSTNCSFYQAPGVPRYGDGNWTQGRLDYVENNYSRDGDSVGVITDQELQGGYHIDDPFRPLLADVIETDGTVTDWSRPDASYPILDNTAWRWNYYNAEVAAVHFSNPTTAYSTTLGEVDFTSQTRTNARDLINDYDAAADGSVTARDGTSLPHCSTEGYTLNPRRRTLVAAVVDCSDPVQLGELNGQSGEGAATWFVETFMTSVAGGVTTGSDFDIDLEIISGALQTGDPSFANGTFRNLVQLYR